MTPVPSNHQRRLPDFVGIGGQRCATSWLFECLSCHPQVFMPEKEIHYFNQAQDAGVDWYLDHFAQARDGQICGEFTPNYLKSLHAMSSLRDLLPNAKLLVSLRNPIDRAYSAFRLYVAKGKIPEQNFQEALGRHPFLVDDGMFGQQLSRLLDNCPREQVKVVFFGRIMDNPGKVVTDVYRWLGIDSDFKPPMLNKYFNVSAAPTWQRMFFLPRIQNALVKSSLGPFLRWLKHSTLSTWFRRKSMVHWNLTAAAAFAELGLMERLMADTELLQTLVNEPVPWKPFFDEVYKRSLNGNGCQQGFPTHDDGANRAMAEAPVRSP